MRRAVILTALVVLAAGSGSVVQTSDRWFGTMLPPAQEPSCAKLTSLALPATSITMAQAVAAGGFTPPNSTAAAAPPPAQPLAPPFSTLPAFCRVAATLKPSADSDIEIEVWLPISGWNGKFMGVGNGGFSGSINYGQMRLPLSRGYAVASTDTGHQSTGADASWALGHPEKQIDFGYRAVHEMTVRAKAIVDAFYSAGPRYSYWNGCSSGGKQGLKEAQRFPDDYDGIIAGAPANFWTHLMAGILWIGNAVRKDPASAIPPNKYGLIHDAVLAQCDAADGVKDGLLTDPRACRFDPHVLECRGADQPTCLTTAQVQALTKVYAPAKNPRTGEMIYPGLAVGGELGWANLPQPFSIGETHFKYIVFGDAGWDLRTLDFDRDVAKADAVDASLGQFNANDPDLSAFKRRGGKLLQYHGWNDQQISPENSINYYQSVTVRIGSAPDTIDFYRLFMVPGMRHCQGGEGAPDQFDTISALEQWVEHGEAPTRIVASHTTNGVVDRTRPLCRYPQIARYTGVGSTDDAVNFACGLP